MRSWVVPALLGLLVVGGCNPSVTAAPTAAPSASGVAIAEQPTEVEQHAVRLRSEWGLQADLAQVRAVASDPRAAEYLSILMLPDEIAEMQARASNADAVRSIVQAEANAWPDDFCGLYIDQQNAGAFTSMWNANLVAHELAIRSKVHPTARLAFRDCRFSKQEIDAVCTGIGTADHAWLQALPATWIGSECGGSANFVTMYISSAAPNAEPTVLQHYTALLGLPPGILVVESDGTGVRLRPWGSVLVTVLDRDGELVGPNTLSLNWFSDREGLQCGGGDVGFGVSWDEAPTELPCQEGTWTIQVVGDPVPDQDFVVYGSAVVQVQGDVATSVTFRLKQAPPPIGP